MTPNTRFTALDAVTFSYRGNQLEGTIARANPRRAVVMVDGTEYHVPYSLLRSETAAMRERRINDVKKTAETLLAKHKLNEWQFRFDHSARRAGSCSYRNKVITLSINLAHNGSDAEINDTLLHEIAHALVGKQHNHDAVWKAKAREIGCSGERTHRMEFAPPRWRVRCENDCWSSTAQRRNSPPYLPTMRRSIGLLNLPIKGERHCGR